MSKVALITGSGRGIGAATAKLLASQGYNVCVNYKMDTVAANKLVAQLSGCGVKCIAIQANVAVEADVLALFQRIDSELGTITALVNNAGILLPQMPIEQMTAQRINQILSTNITSHFLCSREAVKRMSFKHGGNGGAIVNVSSGAAKTGAPGEYLDYAASKGAIDTFTRGLSLEVAQQGIRVNCVRPGFIYTDMHGDGGEPDRVNRIKNQIPMGRGGEPEEVAQAIYWLLSDASSYSSGTFIDVCGGR
ncbi:MAG: NAD(P)-dependent dehydrogenase (short-subunit alcohol dehydrogenase family) [Paraglaciecola sp.]|jgi:NAD(P)-dependent dehydrogenase (short-subunit alcohol dehydrogenase family)